MSQILFQLTHLPAGGVYAFLIIWLAAESAGLPLPDEAILLTTGFLVHEGTVDLVPAVACAVAGAAIGSTISYTLGLRLGRPVVSMLAARLRVRPERVEAAEAWMRRRGAVGVFLTRVLPVARNLASYAAGIADIPPRVFYAAMLCGSLLWSVTVISIGEGVGDHYRQILRVGGRGLLIALCLALAAALVWLAVLGIRRRRSGGGTRP